MPRIIDLSMPIADHFRWPVERQLKSDHERGDLFQVTWLGFAVHGFTHMDSPRHFFADGRTTSDIPLEATVGDAAVVDLARVRPNEAITAAAPGSCRRPRRAGRHRGDEELLGAAEIAAVAGILDRGALHEPRGPRSGCSRASRGRSPSTSRRTTPSASCCGEKSGRSWST